MSELNRINIHENTSQELQALYFIEESYEPQLSDRVIYGRFAGIIRWIGKPPGCKSNRYGIELQQPHGNCDGYYGNYDLQCFNCKPNHGVFCKKKRIFPETRLMRATIKIQTHWRRKMATRLITQNIWNILDNYSENCEQIVEAQLDALEQQIKEYQKKSKTPDIYETSFDPNNLIIPAQYDGTHIRFPIITDTDVIDLMGNFKKGKQLHYSYAFHLVNEMIELLKIKPLVSDITIASDTTLTVCGDTHGQFADLCMIFDRCGYPSMINKFLFNGDFVDRGSSGIEVLLTLYAWKLRYPASVYLNKGNHEAQKLNEKYKFADECIKKYDAFLFGLIQQSFDNLPLCSVIENEVFVVHGGLFRRDDVTLDELRQITYRGQPRSHSSDPTLQLIEDMLWSDPKEGITGIQPSSRGAGCWFGKDVTESFLQHNNLKMIIRSHELVDEGYEILHDGLVVTLFSASHYNGGKNNNKGAYITFTRDKEENSLLTHTYGQYEVEESVFVYNNLERSVIRKLKNIIFVNRHALALALNQYGDEYGTISKNSWAKGMGQIFKQNNIKMDLPWLLLLPKLVSTAAVTPNNRINIAHYLEQYRVNKPLDMSINSEYGQRLIKYATEIMSLQANSIEEVFKKLDHNNDGKISYNEFYEQIKALSEKYPSVDEGTIYDLMRLIDKDNDNKISYYEFINAFSTYESISDALIDKIHRIVMKNKLQFKKAFHLFDADKNRDIRDANAGCGDHCNKLTRDEFINIVRIINDSIDIKSEFGSKSDNKFSEEELTNLFILVDEDRDGFINHHEFITFFSVIY